MAKLTKALVLYDRDDKGDLIPQEVELELSSKDEKEYPELRGLKIAMTPMTRGEIKKTFAPQAKGTERDIDGEIILEHCHDPKLTREELPFVKPVLLRSIVSTICRESGIKLGSDKAVKAEDDFAKNS